MTIYMAGSRGDIEQAKLSILGCRFLLLRMDTVRTMESGCNMVCILIGLIYENGFRLETTVCNNEGPSFCGGLYSRF